MAADLKTDQQNLKVNLQDVKLSDSSEAMDDPALKSRHPRTCSKVFAVILLLLVIALFAAVIQQCTRLYKQLHRTGGNQVVRHSYERVIYGHPVHQTIELDEARNVGRVHVKKVPIVGNFRHAEVIHDFEHRLSAIYDLDKRMCLIKPMDKGMSGPTSMLDLIRRIATGYYMPNPEVIKNKYTLLPDALTGEQMHAMNSTVIQRRCAGVASYRLVPRGSGPADCKTTTSYLHQGMNHAQHDEVHNC